MSRLGGYVTRRFYTEALALVAVVAPLLYLVQSFRILDVITVKGQDIWTLMGQSALSLPLIGSVFLYVCAGIGMARVLGAMQQNGELHAIHSSRRMPALYGAAAAFSVPVAVLVLVLAHLGSPISLQRYDDWAASVAADLVGRALTPHRFAEVVPGITVAIGARSGEGQISEFFADDRSNPAQRRTYSADSAVLARDEQGYVLQMQNGSVQYMTSDLQFSEIRFNRYDLAVQLLTERPSSGNNVTTFALIDEALRSATWDPYTVFVIVARTAEGLRVIGMCLLVFAIAGFPHARRRPGVPLELIVLGFAFADRGLTTYAPQWLGILRPAAGALGLTAGGILLLAYRLWIAERITRLRLGRQWRPA